MQAAKRSFTLLEMLLVVALIGLTFGVIAVQAPKALRGETFERGVDQVKTKITLAQELMLDYHTDVTLKFEPKEGGLTCTIETGKPISERVKRTLERHSYIKGIEKILFDTTEVDEKLTLFFDGTLGATPKGKLILKGKEQEAVLTLKGFPSYPQRGDHVTQDPHASYPEALLSSL